jgi:hypothetical protein
MAIEILLDQLFHEGDVSPTEGDEMSYDTIPEDKSDDIYEFSPITLPRTSLCGEIHRLPTGRCFRAFVNEPSH